jgi:hypothetical protein
MEHDTTNAGPSRRKLSDILNGGGESLRSAWDRTAAAADFAPLPAGTYVARIISGELATAKTGTPGYKLAFRVLEGEHAGRQFWDDIWLTPAALPMAKRDLGKLGVTSLEQLEKPLPPGIRCKVKLALRKGDDGIDYNRVRTFDVLGIDKVEDDDFAPAPVPAPEPPPAPSLSAKAEPDKSQAEMFAPATPQTRSAQMGGL